MLDPLPPAPAWLRELVTPAAQALQLPSLPFHIHEVLFAYVLYQTIESVISPIVSNALFPNIYPKLNRRTRINWDVHVVSLVQSCLINALALWVMFKDEERYDMKSSAVERIYGYTSASGLIQAFATGYFVWDLIVSTRNFNIFGIGIWFHAVSALSVFAFGFVCRFPRFHDPTLMTSQRPFVNYYGPVFILYELSTPFLNVHWFCDKLNMTGGTLQFYNGIMLLATFFGSRLCWGTYQSVRVFQDVWTVLHQFSSVANTTGHVRDVHTSPAASIFVPRDGQLCMGQEACLRAQSEVMKFAHEGTPGLPLWLGLVYLTSNIILHTLNFYWFGRMIETVRKRFDTKPPGKTDTIKRRQSVIEEMADELDQGEISGYGVPSPVVEKSEKEAFATGVSAHSNDLASKRKGGL